jgi:hypothetical protein
MQKILELQRDALSAEVIQWALKQSLMSKACCERRTAHVLWWAIRQLANTLLLRRLTTRRVWSSSNVFSFHLFFPQLALFSNTTTTTQRRSITFNFGSVVYSFASRLVAPGCGIAIAQTAAIEATLRSLSPSRRVTNNHESLGTLLLSCGSFLVYCSVGFRCKSQWFSCSGSLSSFDVPAPATHAAQSMRAWWWWQPLSIVIASRCAGRIVPR